MAKKAARPAGWRKFDQLARGLTDVPKEDVDAKIARDKAKRIKAKKRKKK